MVCAAVRVDMSSAKADGGSSPGNRCVVGDNVVGEDRSFLVRRVQIDKQRAAHLESFEHHRVRKGVTQV